ncbi:hypothetical protein EWB00_010391 [Schistosoma japonicum]|uniref:EGF-like domain-containing protein n=1 Tax=Schistosoma japonicum TaxID=6182 RepID=A0A4Z2DXF6_SCHJA|nr:hypothetical protein EWB00_010391 [Schistosoma japonicum]
MDTVNCTQSLVTPSECKSDDGEGDARHHLLLRLLSVRSHCVRRCRVFCTPLFPQPPPHDMCVPLLSAWIDCFTGRSIGHFMDTVNCTQSLVTPSECKSDDGEGDARHHLLLRLLSVRSHCVRRCRVFCTPLFPQPPPHDMCVPVLSAWIDCFTGRSIGHFMDTVNCTQSLVTPSECKSDDGEGDVVSSPINSTSIDGIQGSATVELQTLSGSQLSQDQFTELLTDGYNQLNKSSGALLNNVQATRITPVLTCSSTQLICGDHASCRNTENGVQCTCDPMWKDTTPSDPGKHCTLHPGTIALIVFAGILLLLAIIAIIYFVIKTKSMKKFKLKTIS